MVSDFGADRALLLCSKAIFTIPRRHALCPGSECGPLCPKEGGYTSRSEKVGVGRHVVGGLVEVK